MAKHNDTGSHGEKLALEWISGKGYTVLHQNWRHYHWEVDIIAFRENTLHFIEIKTRRTQSFGQPEDGVSRKKIINLINAAEEYLIQNHGWKRIQFDILSITLLKDQEPRYFFIEDVYL